MAIKPLSPRERQAVQLVAEGLTMRQVAVEMKIGWRTVSYHLSNARRKLSCRSTAQLAAQAALNGLIAQSRHLAAASDEEGWVLIETGEG